MTTPEGNVKDDIKKVLKEQEVYFHMPVSFGYGAATIDFHPCIVVAKSGNPFPFFIEAKKPGKEPTPRQENLMKDLREKYKCLVWRIRSKRDVAELEMWLQTIKGV